MLLFEKPTRSEIVCNSSKIRASLTGPLGRRAMMIDPKLLILDEPSIGLAPVFVDSVFESIHKINAGGTSILMVEQNAAKALENSHRGYVLEMGNNRFEGNAKEMLENGEVRRLYLGA